MALKRPSPPAVLQDAGRAMWTGITGKYDLRVDELAVLEDACRTSDIIAVMESGLADGQPLLVRGSQGQLVINPLISELRQYRAARAALLRQLKLPEDGAADAAGARSTQARAAANARWARRGA